MLQAGHQVAQLWVRAVPESVLGHGGGAVWGLGAQVRQHVGVGSSTTSAMCTLDWDPRRAATQPRAAPQHAHTAQPRVLRAAHLLAPPRSIHCRLCPRHEPKALSVPIPGTCLKSSSPARPALRRTPSAPPPAPAAAAHTARGRRRAAAAQRQPRPGTGTARGAAGTGCARRARVRDPDTWHGQERNGEGKNGRSPRQAQGHPPQWQRSVIVHDTAHSVLGDRVLRWGGEGRVRVRGQERERWAGSGSDGR